MLWLIQVIIIILLVLFILSKALNVFLKLWLDLKSGVFGSDPPSVSINLIHSTITIQNINIPTKLIEYVNKYLHYNCHFRAIKIGSVSLRLLPYIHLTIRDFTWRGYALHPNDWSRSEVENALSHGRLDMIDTLTSLIICRLNCLRVGEMFTTLQYVPLHMIDILIATVRLDIINISVGFSTLYSGQPDDTMVVVKMSSLCVRPCSTYSSLVWGQRFEVSTMIL